MLLDPLPPAANIEQAIEAFERINSEGTRLGVVDVAAAQLFFAETKLSAAIKRYQQRLSGSVGSGLRFPVFTVDLLVRSMLFDIYREANPSIILRAKKTKLPTPAQVRRAWKGTQDAFDGLKEFLVSDLRMPDSSALQSAKLAVLVASRAFFGRTLSEDDRNRLKRWLVLACTFKPYSGTSTNPNVDSDMASMAESAAINWDRLDQTIQQNARGVGQLAVTPEILSPKDEPLPRNHILRHLTWLLAHHHGAVDWVRATPISPTHPELPDSLWSRHYIFPLSLLRRTGLSEHAQRVGNCAWLSTQSCRSHIRDRAPSDYLLRARLAEWGDSAIRAQAVPDVPSLYSEQNARSFISRREEMLASDMNELLANWGKGKSSRFEVVTRAKKTVEEILAQGDEKHSVEFKSSYYIEPASGTKQPFLRHSALKAIVSLANSGGGIVLIGVADDGTVLGIEQETRALRDLSSSGRAELPNLIMDYAKHRSFPKDKANRLAQTDFMSMEIEHCHGKKVLVIRVYQAPQLIWMQKFPEGDLALESGKKPNPWVIFRRALASTDILEEFVGKEPPVRRRKRRTDRRPTKRAAVAR
jgi:hypothetical protein